MLNPFPDLLVLGFFAPTLLRAVSGILFFYLANIHLKRERAAITNALAPHSGGRVSQLIVLIGALEIIVGTSLVAGFYTQLAALAGLLLAVAFLVMRKKYGPAIPFLGSPFYVLLAVVCASLLLSGAGAIAFDLPL